MGHGEDDDASWDVAVDDGERRAPEEHPPGVRCRRRPSVGERQGAGRSLFDRGGKASAKASLRLVVVADLREELMACSLHEPSRSHRVKRRASANTLFGACVDRYGVRWIVDFEGSVQFGAP